MPSREELRMIVDYNGQLPACDPKFFSDCLPAFYWSKDPDIKEPIFAWGVYFAYGCAICYLKTSYYPVRAVREGYSRHFGDIRGYDFKDNGDGTVTDLNTNLMWKKNTVRRWNW